MELAFVTANQSTEQEASGRAGDEHVTVERAGELGGIELLAPDFVAGAIVPDPGLDGDRDLPGGRTGRDDQ